MVEGSFRITGRGVGVFGSLRSGDLVSGSSGCLHLADGTIIPVSRIDVEYAGVSGGERVGLLLRDLFPGAGAPGSVVRSGAKA